MPYILVMSGSLEAIVKNGKDSVLRMAIDTMTASEIKDLVRKANSTVLKADLA